MTSWIDTSNNIGQHPLSINLERVIELFPNILSLSFDSRKILTSGKHRKQLAMLPRETAHQVHPKGQRVQYSGELRETPKVYRPEVKCQHLWKDSNSRVVMVLLCRDYLLSHPPPLVSVASVFWFPSSWYPVSDLSYTVHIPVFTLQCTIQFHLAFVSSSLASHRHNNPLVDRLGRSGDEVEREAKGYNK